VYFIDAKIVSLDDTFLIHSCIRSREAIISL
jgi:hypothetical protein